MLGQKQRALAVLEALLGDRRPAAWCQWPEVVWADPRAPGGILIESPLERPLRAAEVDGRAHPVLEARRVHLVALAAEVILHH
jgi:hypothetical protein